MRWPRTDRQPFGFQRHPVTMRSRACIQLLRYLIVSAMVLSSRLVVSAPGCASLSEDLRGYLALWRVAN